MSCVKTAEGRLVYWKTTSPYDCRKSAETAEKSSGLVNSGKVIQSVAKCLLSSFSFVKRVNPKSWAVDCMIA